LKAVHIMVTWIDLRVSWLLTFVVLILSDSPVIRWFQTCIADYKDLWWNITTFP